MLSKIIREKAIDAIESLHGIRFTERDFQVSSTKPEFEGDYTIVLFSLIKQLKSSPETLGNALGNKMIADDPVFFDSFNVIKGFLNFTIQPVFLLDMLNKHYQDPCFGKAPLNGKKVMVEYSSPNTNKPLHLGHLRNNFLGRSIAEKKLKLILEVFPEIPNGYKPTESELSKVSGIGEISAKQFLEGLPLFFDFMKELDKECKKVEKVLVPKGKSLEGLVVVFTGVRDKELEALIEAKGGKVGSSVSSKTKILVAKDPSDDSSKIKSAKELGIPVVTIDTFKKNYL